MVAIFFCNRAMRYINNKKKKKQPQLVAYKSPTQTQKQKKTDKLRHNKEFLEKQRALRP